MNETASRACSGVSTRGTMIPWAPRSRARPMRSRSPDGGRTMAAVGVAPIAWRLARRSASVPAPCSRSISAQSNPARATISVGDRRRQVEERAVERLAGGEPGVQVDEAGGRRGPLRLVSHGDHDGGPRRRSLAAGAGRDQSGNAFGPRSAEAPSSLAGGVFGLAHGDTLPPSLNATRCLPLSIGGRRPTERRRRGPKGGSRSRGAGTAR